MAKKILFLSLALLLPVLVFVFLKFFGKNEFDVPLLYQEGVTEVPNGCDVKYPVPYALPDSVMGKFSEEKSSVIVIDFSEQPSAEMQAIKDEFKNDVVIRSYSSVNFADKNFIRDCVLLMKQYSIVMIDSENRIRGYYENDREETDRLAVELKIVLKKY